MTDQMPAPLPVSEYHRLDLQFGRGLVVVMIESGVQKIRALRAELERGGKHLPIVRTRDNTTLAPFSFLLHHDGRLVADGDFATLGDILQALSRTAAPPPPPKIVPARRPAIVTDDAVDDSHCVIIN